MNRRTAPRRLETLLRSLRALVVVATGGLLAGHAESNAAAEPTAPPPDDPISGFVVPADGNAERPLPKIVILPSLSPDMEDVTLQSVVRRDLELSGEFEILGDNVKPDGFDPYAPTIDVKAWGDKGAEALVRLVGKKLNDTTVELRAQAYLVESGNDPIFDKRFEVPLTRVRAESHYVSDQVMGALTGTQGGFFSHLTFVSGIGSRRRVYRIDSDGFDAKAISPVDHVAIAPAYGQNGELYWSASIDKDEYKIFRASDPTTPIKTNVKGSVYGLAFSKDYSQVAVSIGINDTIKVFTGPSFDQLKEASNIGLAMRPNFTPTGKLAFAGEGKFGQRIYVDGKAISPDGLMASAPTFCRHPDGIRAVFAVGVGKTTDLVATGESGGGLYRLTQGMGSNGYPACSPDGRLVAFFSTRSGAEGLYVMRVSGGRAKRVSTLMGDSLRWDRLPPTQAIEKK
ncbi:MAG: tolB protein [Polyangiaceae bacterium]